MEDLAQRFQRRYGECHDRSPVERRPPFAILPELVHAA